MAILKFNKKKHQYTLDGEELQSVTIFIGQFFKPFEARKIARMLAKFPINRKKKHGVRYFLKEWKEAADFGTRVHKGIETHLINNCHTADERESNYIYQAINWLYTIKHMKNVSGLEVERIVYNEKHMIAGTIDLLLLSGKKVTLIDWKTNKAIKKKGYKGEKGKEPLQEVDDCNFNKYTMQLSLYAYMLELQGYEIEKLIMVHLTENNAVEYELKYEKELIKKMLEVKNDRISNEV